MGSAHKGAVFACKYRELTVNIRREVHIKSRWRNIVDILPDSGHNKPPTDEYGEG